MLIDSTSCYLVCNNQIFCSVNEEDIVEAVLTLIGMFYLLDIDYPKQHEVRLMMQNLLFGDTSTPGDLISTISSLMADNTSLRTQSNFVNSLKFNKNVAKALSRYNINLIASDLFNATYSHSKNISACIYIQGMWVVIMY